MVAVGSVRFWGASGMSQNQLLQPFGRPRSVVGLVIEILVLVALGVAAANRTSDSSISEGNAAIMANWGDSQQFLCVGPTTLDVLAQVPAEQQLKPGKNVAEIRFEPGGGAANVAEAIYAASGIKPLLAPLTGADETGNLVCSLAAEFSLVRRCAALTETRRSMVLPPLVTESQGITLTTRPGMDSASVIEHITPLLNPAQLLVLASFRAEDFVVLQALIDANPGHTCLLPTASQCADRERTLELAGMCDFVSCNADELESLTGHRDELGMLRVHSCGAGTVLITDGPRGATLYADGEFGYQPAFDVVQSGSNSKCGDISCGTFLAASVANRSPARALATAMAAAGMHRSRMPRTSLAEMERFAASTPKLVWTPAMVRASQDRIMRPRDLHRTLLRHPAALLTMGAAFGMVALQSLAALTHA